MRCSQVRPIPPHRTLIGAMMMAIWVGGACACAGADPAPPAPPPAPAEGRAPAAPVSARPETARLTPDQKRDLKLLIDVLADAKIDLSKRRDAAASLLARGWPAAIDELSAMLNGSDDPSTHTAIAMAVAQTPRPPRLLVDPLLKLIGTPDAKLRQAVASALGRYEDDRVMEQLIAIAADNQRDQMMRLGAIEALAEYRQTPAVDALVNALKPGADRQISSAAAGALQHLTGITRYGDDPQAWAQWWAEHRELPPQRWLGRLTRSLGIRNQQLEQEQVTLTARLTDVYNRLYTATEPTQRPALLQEMLSDPTAALRLLALRLVERNLLSAQPISDQTRQAMREKLTDTDPLVRAKVATLLRDLGDEAAARDVAGRLLPEPVVSVQTAYLSLLQRMPQAEAVDPALLLLGREPLRSAAAAYLVVATDAALLSPAQRIGALKLSRDAMAKGDPIDPAIVQLIGRLGGETDAPMLVQLLDSDPPAVRRAAADAFVVGAFEIGPLLAKLADPQLTDKAIEAAAKRGASPAVINRLLAGDPTSADLRPTWVAAIVAVAGRLDVDALVAIDDALAAQPPRQDVRLAILKIAAQPRPVNGEENAAPPVDEPARLALILRLAKVYLQTDQAALARPLFDRLAAASKLPASDRPAVRAGQLRSALATGAIDEGVKLAEQWIAAEGAAKTEVGTLLMDAAEAALGRKQTEQAAALVGRAVQMVGDALDPKDASRLEKLREQLKPLQAAPPAASPGA